MQHIQQQLQYEQFGIGAAGDFSNLWNQGLRTGMEVGQQQYGYGTDQINRQYEEWLRTQPQYNPMLQYMSQLATGGTPMTFPQYRPSAWSQLLNAGAQVGAAFLGK